MTLREMLSLAIKNYLEENFSINVIGKLTCFLNEDKIVLVENKQNELTNLYSCNLDKLILEIEKNSFFKI